MRHLENKHAGEVGLVLGNGPSLKKVPRDLLDKYPTFGTNRIYLYKGFTPTYYAAVDPLFIRPSKDEINRLPCPKFIRHWEIEGISNAYPLRWSREAEFSLRPWHHIYEGYSIVFVCLQLAYFMGFETVLLVGVDFRYKEIGSDRLDPNHFYEYCFGPEERWSYPDMDKAQEAFVLAREAYDAAGKKIINLTPRSSLKVFEKGRYEDWTEPVKE